MAATVAMKMPVLAPEPAAAEIRRDAVRDFKRAAILAAAQKIFGKFGLEGATIRAIAQAAGYTAGAVYSYYPTKEAIYADILAQSLVTLRERRRRSRAGRRRRARASCAARSARSSTTTGNARRNSNSASTCSRASSRAACRAISTAPSTPS